MYSLNFKKKFLKKINFAENFIFIFKFLNKLDNLKKTNKKILIIGFDFFLIIFSYLLTNYFFVEHVDLSSSHLLAVWTLPVMLLTSTFFYIVNGDYLSISRYINSSEIYNIVKRNLILIIILLFVGYLFRLNISSPKVYILFWFISSFVNIIARFSLKEILVYSGFFKLNKINKVAIYGAGAAGAQLASSLLVAGSHKIEGFFDDSPNLFGRKLLGVRIYSSKDIYKFKNKIDQILFAIPSLSREKSMVILDKIKKYEIPVLKVPSIKELTEGNLSINELRPIEIEDLLGRVAMEPNKQLLNESTENLNICITGAGGSIGKEIFREIIKLKPKTILLIDSNEYSLYSLEQEIKERLTNKADYNVHLKLGDVRDFNFLKYLFKSYFIDVVYHAAAYKHVPLIEKNPLSGIENNIISTYSICKAAVESNLSKVTLISTDKAVRPTNVMGATKRFAELILQSFAQEILKINSKIDNVKNKNQIKFLIVRFGNVLGSSGSVVPLFKKQIAKGGPITLTDERIIRYFMTMPEAAQLVIQATSLSKGGDVFILDMGEPIKIKSLAEQMIRLSGLKVKSKNFKNGDIEILTTGLRPGEKLYEELLIEGNPLKTSHPKIFRANEEKIPFEELLVGIDALKSSINNLDEKSAIKILSKFVPEWHNRL